MRCRVSIVLFFVCSLFAVTAITCSLAMECTEEVVSISMPVIESNYTHTNHYAYSTLSDENKVVYSVIYDALVNFRESSPMSNMDAEDIQNIYKCVMLDSPELFYVRGLNITTRNSRPVKSLTVSGDYYMSREEAKKAETRISKYVQAFLSTIPVNCTDYERVKRSYEYIVNNTTYVPGAPFNQSMYSVFNNSRSVCLGYSKAFQYLMYEQDIPCILVTGEAGTYTTNHSWNMVKLDDAYYHVDTTWGDMYDNETVSYDFLLIDDETIAPTHTIMSVVEYPACTSMKYNYYAMTDTYITDTNTACMERILPRLEKDEELVLKFANTELLDYYEGYLITNKKLFDYVSGDVDYILNRKMCTLAIEKGSAA